ncbi:MAG TPA: ATP-dependent RNA helicase HrpA, partial [Polyangiaceae bacterium]|nr:ATP-dependent RNA helicase HrpA [Polyangiaceae bacterium]
MSGPSTDPCPTRRSPIRFPPELPISARVPDLVSALERSQVVIVVGATGSGKTTQLPKVALEMGRGGKRQIGVTQPRRIAATSVAARVARELECELGNEVGYQIRFEDRSGPNTWVKFMTDGVLLAEIQSDRLLHRYDTLIIDEAHERSLNIDFLLGWLKLILPKRRDLKVIVSSATIATEHFSEFFDNAPVVQVEGRTYPVEVLYEPPALELELSDAVADAVANITSLDPHGDVLVFLPGEREIREAEQALLSKNLRHTEVLPLYARLSGADQAKVFAPCQKRRLILATNVAETSLTIPGIVYVVDTGVARLSRYDPKTGTTRLQIEGISQASADQRKGRCGRVREGICVRLYDEESFKARPAYTDPEMKRTGLAGVILRMKSLGLGDVEHFPFLDPPHTRSISEGYRVLEELGALGEDRELTPLGRRLAQFPVDPRVARMVLAGAEFDCLPEVLVVASGLNVQDPRERPRGKESKADQLHQRFRDESSDFLGLLRLWTFLREEEQKSHSQLRRACKEGFLSYLRVREWSELHRQLEDLVRELKVGTLAPRQGRKAAPVKCKSSDALHMALLSGLLSRIGQWNAEQRTYLGARQTRFAIHPSSGLAKKPPAWLMVFELVQTSQLFARMVAKIDPLWLEQVGGHLMKRSYSDPHWSEKSARASIKEHATLFGLPVLKDRSVDYSAVAPARARMMFIEHALVRGEYESRGTFQQKNRELQESVATLRNKARKSDMLADDEQIHAFFDQRIPDTVVNGKTFETWREAAERANPNLLRLSIADVMPQRERLRPEDYPDHITLHGVKLAATYQFDPTADDDGVTLTVPLAFLPQLSHGELDWTIPAWHEQKLLALLEELPRAQRRELSSLPELAEELARKLQPFSGPLLPALAQALFEVRGVRIASSAFRPEAIPAYLRFNCRVLAEGGKVLAESRDVALLLDKYAASARELLSRTAQPPEQPSPRATSWVFGELPAFVNRRVQGTQLRCYPALADRQTAVELVLLETQEAAAREHRDGVRRLLSLNARTQLTVLGKRAPGPFKRRLGVLVTRAEADAFRDLLLSRVVDIAFGLDDLAAMPRSKVAFDRLIANGTPRLATVFDSFLRTINAIAAEHDKLLRAVDSASKHPSGAATTLDIRDQLDRLFPNDLLARIELRQLEHYPRYLRAAQVRLARAVVDPRKDAAKAAPFAPLWKEFTAKASARADDARMVRLRGTFEELRVALFAPELKTAEPVTLSSLARELAAL